MLVVFGYNFPHGKTVRGLLQMAADGIRPDLVVLQDRKTLNIPQSEYRVSPRGEHWPQPQDVCKALGFVNYVGDHDDFAFEADTGVILGARILKQPVISKFRQGILNLHPGILPGNRGLDNLKHAILKRLPIGVTAHWIDARVDMGQIITTRVVPVYADDTIREVHDRQMSLQIELLGGLLRLLVLRDTKISGYPCPPCEKFTAVTPEEDARLETAWEQYKAEFAVDAQRKLAA